MYANPHGHNQTTWFYYQFSKSVPIACESLLAIQDCTLVLKGPLLNNRSVWVVFIQVKMVKDNRV